MKTFFPLGSATRLADFIILSEDTFGYELLSFCYISSGLHGYTKQRPGTEDHLQNSVLYSLVGVGRTASVISISMSSVLPLLSIVALNYIHSTNARIGAVCGFTLLFSLCLGVVTNAKSGEVFAVAAA